MGSLRTWKILFAVVMAVLDSGLLSSTNLYDDDLAPMPLQTKPAPASLRMLEPPSGECSSPNPETKQTPDAQDLPSTAAVIEEAEILHASIRAGSVAQIVVAGIAVIGLLYLLKVVMATTPGLQNFDKVQ